MITVISDHKCYCFCMFLLLLLLLLLSLSLWLWLWLWSWLSSSLLLLFCCCSCCFNCRYCGYCCCIPNPNKMYDKGRTDVCADNPRTSKDVAVPHRGWDQGDHSFKTCGCTMGCNECFVALQQKQCAFDVEGGSLSKFVGTAIPRQGVSFGQTVFPRLGPNQRRRNTNLLGDAAHGWARTLLTMILSAQMDNSSCAQRLSERFPTNGAQNYFLEWQMVLWIFFGHRQVKSKQKIIPLSAPPAEVIDDEAETLQDQVLSDGYSASEPLDMEDAEGRQDPMEA